MRSIWKGVVSFGLVSIPVALYKATEGTEVSFHQVHKSDGGRVRVNRKCSDCGDTVTFADIGKGLELPTGETILLTDDELGTIRGGDRTQAAEILQFVDQDEVSPLMYAGHYYLAPGLAGEKAYALLRDALAQKGCVGILKITLRSGSKEKLAMLRPDGELLILTVLSWPEEIRQPDFAFLGAQISASKAELTMAGSLIEALAGTFDVSAYKDENREAIEALAAAKLKGTPITAPAPKAPPKATVDLMAQLQASVDAARGKGKVA